MSVSGHHNTASGLGLRAAGAPTPPQEEALRSAHATYVPHDLRYDEAFEDAVMRLLLSPHERAADGIKVISADSPEQSVDDVSVRAQDFSPLSLPIVSENELPLPLDDARRRFASPVPGIKLTQPGGYLEGGPGLNPQLDTFAEDFFSNNPHINSLADLRAYQSKEIDASMLLLRERMQARKDAKTRNEQIERDLQKMEDEHRMEKQINKKLADERRAKKEAKERRRAGRETG